VIVGAPDDPTCEDGCGRAFAFDAASAALLTPIDNPHLDFDVHFGTRAVADAGRVLLHSPGGRGRDGGLVTAFALTCGNDSTEPGESCDDGNATDGDGCDTNCTVSACGNGVVAPGEECDDGNLTDGDACTAACAVAVCGDGIVRVGFEQCDDGNHTDGDGCDASCHESLCIGGGEIRDARLDVTGLGEPYGDERVVLRGELVLPAGVAAPAPASVGLQTMLRDADFPLGFGMNGALDFNAPAGNPVPPGPRGTGCAPGDGWRTGPGGTESVYLNRSGAIDPPLCTAGSAYGLRRIRIADARPAGGIRFRIESIRATVGEPVLPLLAGVVLGAERASGMAGSCALRALTAEDCRWSSGGGALRCRVPARERRG